MTTGNPTEAARTYAEQACYQDENRPIAEAGFRAGWKAARTRLAAQKPTDAEVEAAQAEVVLHAPDFAKPGAIRCHCGAPGFWGTPDAHEQHALWHVLRAARRDEEAR